MVPSKEEQHIRQVDKKQQKLKIYLIPSESDDNTTTIDESNISVDQTEQNENATENIEAQTNGIANGQTTSTHKENEINEEKK